MRSHSLMAGKLRWAVVPVAGVILAVAIAGRAPRAEEPLPRAGHDRDHPMTHQAMQRWVDDWFANHPMVGGSLEPATAAAVGATFLVGPGSSLRFDLDGNLSTVVDTAKIIVGDQVRWQWVSGSHTVTSGTGASDPQAGALFDAPSSMASPIFTSNPFNTVGTFPFFCRPHEGFNMKGIVRVFSAVGVGSVLGDGGARGFTAAPSPNPSRSAVGFQFGLRERGRARAEVFDVRGRRVAVILDRELDAGLHHAAWDGLGGDGTVVPAGVYHLRLSLPGFRESRRVVIAR